MDERSSHHHCRKISNNWNPSYHEFAYLYSIIVEFCILSSLSDLAYYISKGTVKTQQVARKKLKYLSMNPNELIRYESNQMRLNIFSNVLYLSYPTERIHLVVHL